MQASIEAQASWRPVLDQLACGTWQRVLVLGAPDRGKSSFCDLLLRLLQAQGTKAMLLDTALGEKTVGPPACLTLGRIETGAYSLKDLYFVGGLDSARRMAAIVSGAARLADRAEGQLVIDTSGTFNGPGRVLKGLKIDTLCPDHIVALGRDDELEPFLALLPQGQIHRLPPADGAQARNAMTRALGRLQAFQAVLAGARPHVLQGLAVEPWDEDAYDWTHGEYICGLADAKGDELGLGILNGVDTANGTFRVTTTAAPDRIRRIRVGMSLPEELKI
jgi:polynucleotide 5'-hydroxyl-kinase GRC3/NOL9